MTAESPIVQVPEPDHYEDELIYQQQADDDEFDASQDAIPQTLKLDLRGTRVDLDRETLVSLPESLLIAMFPNGLALPQNDYEDDYDQQSVDAEVIYIDFDPSCLDFVLQYYQLALRQGDPAALLMNKQPVIVLREELEYFCVPNKSKHSMADMASLKLACGEHLRQLDEIFAALQKNIQRESNVAEQHLIDMLCDAGFSPSDRWGYRALEPMRTCIMSMGLVLLKNDGSDKHMATARKLLLFWRKPARKCWWDGTLAELQSQTVRVWSRRTWTLELALV
ncbi:hypothetical protein DFQ28_005346 [Apophysomyces sp. BC1034]|nr:hypothetical protein DFQ30_005216 [Apophysomyces sp. BC1015]KAG0177865.1 hypothetical protein DFQ29_004262 [Apophysomyces sp. BC1021]KAG0188117.1 hypothetical protein DFQ28_005346 [Apophysomyces sp. BC1034]